MQIDIKHHHLYNLRSNAIAFRVNKSVHLRKNYVTIDGLDSGLFSWWFGNKLKFISRLIQRYFILFYILTILWNNCKQIKIKKRCNHRILRNEK